MRVRLCGLWISATHLPLPGRRGARARRRAAETAAVEAEETPRFRWDALGSGLSEPQDQAIRGLSPKLPNRCRALMPRVVALSPGDESLGVVLAFWVKAMKPKRADWLLVLKELKAMESPLLAEVLEYALLEDSFEANVRDYTKLIQFYGKQNLLREAEEAFQAMKARGLPCDGRGRRTAPTLRACAPSGRAPGRGEMETDEGGGLLLQFDHCSFVLRRLPDSDLQENRVCCAQLI